MLSPQLFSYTISLGEVEDIDTRIGDMGIRHIAVTDIAIAEHPDRDPEPDK